MPAFDTALAVLDWLGLVVFAVTGALVASRKEMDIVGFVLLGTATGIGGGTLRDLVLDVPVFWTVEPAYLTTCVVVSCLIFFTAHIPQSRWVLLLWFDAAGLALFAVAGAEKALAAGTGPAVAIFLGVATATFGGILRDVIGAEPSIALRREIYVTAALLAAAAYVALAAAGAPREVAIGTGLAAGFALRGAALRYGWSLPRYRPRPGRTPDEIGR
ncbi:trimeric intracellular cation channel family protein [Salinarimonas rosea]|uniref:trimeric intracellular cation channel family protein n=1 Tax=Salinarimonas rosea TaxID=552063 RepID=UPI0003F76F03|nr:trimeric intracellular cation channel family protein [Salinarimonas rosea]